MANYLIKEKLVEYETLRINTARKNQANGISKNNHWLPPGAGKAKGGLLAHSASECHPDSNIKHSNQAHAAGSAGGTKVAIGPGPNDRCNYDGHEKYNHTNKQCFEQHPELRPATHKPRNPNKNNNTSTTNNANNATNGQKDSETFLKLEERKVADKITIRGTTGLCYKCGEPWMEGAHAKDCLVRKGDKAKALKWVRWLREEIKNKPQLLVAAKASIAQEKAHKAAVALAAQASARRRCSSEQL